MQGGPKDVVGVWKESGIVFPDGNKWSKVEKEVTRELLVEVCNTALQTKIHPRLAIPLTEVIVDAIRTIQRNDRLDLHMIELMHM